MEWVSFVYTILILFLGPDSKLLVPLHIFNHLPHHWWVILVFVSIDGFYYFTSMDSEKNLLFRNYCRSHRPDKCKKNNEWKKKLEILLFQHYFRSQKLKNVTNSSPSAMEKKKGVKILVSAFIGCTDPKNPM